MTRHDQKQPETTKSSNDKNVKFVEKINFVEKDALWSDL